MLMLMSAVETGQMSAVETRHLPPPLPSSPPRLAPRPAAGEGGGGGQECTMKPVSLVHSHPPSHNIGSVCDSSVTEHMDPNSEAEAIVNESAKVATI